MFSWDIVVVLAVDTAFLLPQLPFPDTAAGVHGDTRGAAARGVAHTGSGLVAVVGGVDVDVVGVGVQCTFLPCLARDCVGLSSPW